MITNLAAKIADWLIKGGSIKSEDKDLYQYGLFFFLTAFMFLLSAIILGLLFGILTGSIVFFISFFLIRQFAGGYHAKTEARCQIMSLISILLSISSIAFFKGTTPLFMLIAANVFGVVIFLLSPVDTEERDLAPEEISVFRKISRIIIIILLCVANSTFFISKTICTSFCVAILLEGILLSSAFLKKAILRSKKTPHS